MVEGILVEGLIYGILALGVFVSFRVLDFSDLAIEASFPAGAAAAASFVVLSAKLAMPPLIRIPLTMLLGFAAGSLVGLSTAAIYHKLKVPQLLAGIVALTGFYSINLRLLGGKPNVPLISNNPLLNVARTWLGSNVNSNISLLLASLLVCVLVVVILNLFFHTEMGIAMGAMGDNPGAVIQAGINPAQLRTKGLMLANGLAGLSGALAASYQGFADVNFGQGVVAAGLASVMLGELLLRSQFIALQLARVIAGSILFRALMYAARVWGYQLGIKPNDLRLITALLIISAIAISRMQISRMQRKKS